MNRDVWIDYKLFQHRDTVFGTGSSLLVEVTSVAKENSDFTRFGNEVETLGLKLQINNDVSKSKAVLFSYHDCISFVAKATKIIKNISRVPVGAVYTLKKKNQLLIELIQTQDASSSRLFKLTITDSNNTCFIVVSAEVLYVVSVLFKNYVQSYIPTICHINMNYNLYKVRSGLRTLYESISKLNNNISALSSGILDIMQNSSHVCSENDTTHDSAANGDSSDTDKQTEKQEGAQDKGLEDHNIGLNSKFDDFFNSESFDYVLKDVDSDLKKS